MEIEEEKEEQGHLLPDEIKYAIVFYKRQELSDKETARRIQETYHRSLGHSTVKTIWEKYQQTNTVSNQWAQQTRPKLLNTEDLQRLEEAVRENPRKSAEELRNQLDLPVSRETVNRELLRMGYHAYRAPTKPLLEPRHMTDRLSFARSHQSWTPNRWGNVIFSDESSFPLVMTNGRLFIRRRPEEALQEGTFQPTQCKSKSILVWGAISDVGVGPLVRITGTVDADGYLAVFRHRLWWYYPGLYNGDLIFQDDGASPHTAEIVDNWFRKYEINRMNDWPARSPDLNIVEDIWNHIKYQIRGKSWNNLDELWEEVVEQWNQVSLELIHSLYESLPNRMQAVISTNGGVTRY